MSELLLHPKTKTHSASLLRPGVYVVHGPKGIGKTSFVSSVLAVHRPVTVRPDEKGTITVKTIKELTTKLHYKATGTQAAVIVDDAHNMTMAAQNAFLKTLEEMPGNVSSVLITDHLYGLLPTVRSRCHLLYMPPPTATQFEDWLEGLNDGHNFSTVKQYHFTPAPAVAAKDSLENSEVLESVPSLFGDDLYSRLVAAKKLSAALPDILPRIISYIRLQLRSDPRSVLWQRYLDASISCLRLSEARVSERTLLDVIAMAGGRRG